jgi:hypothetical protein
MAGTKWTPGPWRADVRPAFGDRYVRQDPKNWDGMGYQHICALPADKKGTHYGDMFAANARLIAAAPDLYEALSALVEAKALAGVRELVAGWNGETRPDGPFEARHPSRLGATLPKTDCGSVYDLDAAMQNARAALAKALGDPTPTAVSTPQTSGAER